MQSAGAKPDGVAQSGWIRRGSMRSLVGLVAAVLVGTNFAFADAPELNATQNPNALYRLFNTKNIYNLLLLNTMDGSIQRLQWGQAGSVSLPLPKCSGATLGTKAGRYTLQSTQNIW